MVAVVPAPSTRAALRARGRDPVRVLAVAFARGLELGGVPARVTPVLRQVRSRDQVGLGSRARGGRLDTIRRRRRVPLRGLAHVLVDDVLTSGATLAAAENELIRAGIPVLGGYVLAATPAPRRPRGP